MRRVLGLGDVGHRVVVRRIIGVRDNRPIFSDALGQLVAIDDSQLTVQTAGGAVHVPLTQVVRAKRVPAQRRPGRAEVAALEWAGARAWPAPETDRLGEWLLRAAGGWTGRANSALAVGDPGLPLPAAIEAVRAWYAARDLPARINVPLPLATAVDAALDERGWARAPRTLVQAAPLAGLVTGEARSDLPAVTLTEAPAPEWLAMVADRKKSLPPAAIRVLTGPPLVRFAAVHAADGTLLAGGRGAVTDGRLHLGLIEVAPQVRRRGLARHVIRALAVWAADQRATLAYLQVEEHNEPAVALYEGLGFATHHGYVTRTGTS
jgi:N-acetylglutamate synthase